MVRSLRAVGVVEYFRPVLLPFAVQHFKGITKLFRLDV